MEEPQKSFVYELEKWLIQQNYKNVKIWHDAQTYGTYYKITTNKISITLVDDYFYGGKNALFSAFEIIDCEDDIFGDTYLLKDDNINKNVTLEQIMQIITDFLINYNK